LVRLARWGSALKIEALPGAFVVALILAFMAWIWVYKSSFGTSWLGGFGKAVLAVVIFAITSVVLEALFGLVVPTSFFPHF
jgi:hypothetical protein